MRAAVLTHRELSEPCSPLWNREAVLHAHEVVLSPCSQRQYNSPLLLKSSPSQSPASGLWPAWLIRPLQHSWPPSFQPFAVHQRPVLVLHPAHRRVCLLTRKVSLFWTAHSHNATSSRGSLAHVTKLTGASLLKAITWLCTDRSLSWIERLS